MDRLMEVAQSATTLEEYHRLMREANQYATAQHWILWGGRVPQFNVHQPWVKGYNGETDLYDIYHVVIVFSRLCIDQELKKETGFEVIVLNGLSSCLSPVYLGGGFFPKRRTL